MKIFRQKTAPPGFTLIELMIAMAIGLVLIAGVFQLFISQKKVYSVQEQLLESQQNVRAGMDYIIRSLQTAGYDPTDSQQFGVSAYQTGAPYFRASNDAGLALTTNAELYFTTDDSGDGNIDNNGTERFGYKITNNTLELASIATTGASAGDISSWQPLAENIESMTIVYTYANGALSSAVGLPDNSVAGRNFADIRAVTVSLTARTSRQDSDYTDPALGDGYRRQTLASTIMLRNLGF